MKKKYYDIIDAKTKFSVMAYDVPFKQHPLYPNRVLTHEEEFGEFDTIHLAIEFCKKKSVEISHPFHLFYITGCMLHKSVEEWINDFKKEANDVGK